jgi:Domain of unknown function (DUF6362)
VIEQATRSPRQRREERSGGARFVGREAIPALWDVAIVSEKIVQAFVTLDLLETVRGPRKPGGHWPSHIVEWADKVSCAGMDPIEKKMRYEAANRTVIRPSSAEITQMEAVFEWLSELRVEDQAMARVVSLWGLRTARGLSIRALCREKGWAPRTFFRQREKGLEFLAEWLNRRAVAVF